MKTLHIISNLINQIDIKFKRQLGLIIENDKLQELQIIWNELNLLTQSVSENSSVIIQLLNINKKELTKDLSTNLEVEYTASFKHVVESHLGMSGAPPISLLVGGYDFNIDNKTDIHLLTQLSVLASYALSPFISNCDFPHLATTNNYITGVLQKLHLNSNMAWQNFRTRQDSRFVFLLMGTASYSGESTINSDSSLKSRAASLATAQLIKSFKETSWFLEINGKIVLPPEITKLSTEKKLKTPFLINAKQSEEASQYGINFLVQENKQSPLSLYNLQSVHASTDRNIFLLEHLTTACHFGHYIKAIAQNKIGSLTTETECQVLLQKWLNKYTANTNTPSSRATYPLKSYNISIMSVPGKVGHFNCNISLEPHMKLDSLTTKIILNSEILVNNLI